MELDELRLPSNPELWVKMRRRILWGDEIAVESAVISAQRLDPYQGVAALKRQRVYQLIEGWNLRLGADNMSVGAEGAPLPMSPDSLRFLAPEDGEHLYAYARHRFEEREDVENPFQPGSPRSSPASGPPRSSRRRSS